MGTWSFHNNDARLVRTQESYESGAPIAIASVLPRRFWGQCYLGPTWIFHARPSPQSHLSVLSSSR